MQRRTLLKVIGGSLVAVGAGATAFLATRDPAAARAPWQAASGEGDPRLFVLRHAILAPNPHNRQPWMIALDDDNGATVYCDLDRRLPETDPFDRQIVIGFGCFLELAAIAAAEKGLGLGIAYFPEGEPGERLDNRPIARLTFEPSRASGKDPLFGQILHRRSVKEAFDTARPLGLADLDALASSDTATRVSGSIDQDLVQSLRDLTWQAWVTEAEFDPTYMESVDLMRIGKAEIEANPDGIDLGGPLFESLKLVGLFDRQTLADRTSLAYRSGEDVYRAIMASSMGFLWWTSPGNGRIDQLEAGRQFVRTHLQATGLGMAFHPVSQCLQEYPAVRQLFDKAHSLLGIDSPSRIQMLARIGYAAVEVPPAPRWPLEAKLRTA